MHHARLYQLILFWHELRFTSLWFPMGSRGSWFSPFLLFFPSNFASLCPSYSTFFSFLSFFSYFVLFPSIAWSAFGMVKTTRWRALAQAMLIIRLIVAPCYLFLLFGTSSSPAMRWKVGAILWRFSQLTAQNLQCCHRMSAKHLCWRPDETVMLLKSTNRDLLIIPLYTRGTLHASFASDFWYERSLHDILQRSGSIHFSNLSNDLGKDICFSHLYDQV